MPKRFITSKLHEKKPERVLLVPACDNSTKRNIEKGVCSKSIRYVFRMADTKNSY